MSGNKPHLEIDAHVVIQLGAELISDSEQALLELVKNAYDADASVCRIIIEPDWTPDKDHAWKKHLNQSKAVGRIVVRDDGTGLSENAVEHGWLLISASLKRPSDGIKKTTVKKRIPVGDKGLGRLATMRLGDVLVLHTQTENEKTARTAAFAWSEFKSGKTLQAVEVYTGKENGFADRDHGTEVEIMGLLEPGYWDSTSNIDSVISKLSALVSPFDKFTDFRVEVEYNEQIHLLHSMSAEALNFAAAKFKFSYEKGALDLSASIAPSLFRGNTMEDKHIYEERFGSLDNKIKTLGQFKKNKRLKNLESKLDEPGGWLFEIKDRFLWSDMPKDPRLLGAKDPGPFDGEIYYFLFNSETKQQFAAANISMEVLRNAASIGIFRDGFKVKMNEDWLDLAAGTTTGGFYFLRPKNSVGYFAIDNAHNPNLVEKSDREGFVDNDWWRGFMRLAQQSRQFSNHTLDAARVAYNSLQKAASLEANEGSAIAPKEAREQIRAHTSNVEDTLAKVTSSNDRLLERINETKNRLLALSAIKQSKDVDLINKEFKELSRYMEGVVFTLKAMRDSTTAAFKMTRRMSVSNEELNEHNIRLIDAAAVGLSARSLAHEINTYLTPLEKAVSAIARANKEVQDSKIGIALDAFSTNLREVKKVVASINPLIGGSRSIKDSFYVGDAIEEFMLLRKSRIDEFKVKPHVIGGKGIKIRFSKVRFTQILENLLQNSLYWINEHSENEDVKKEISVEITKDGFVWSDGGKGVRPAIEDTIFEPYVTDKPLSKGQGLGLFIVKSFLEAEKCEIDLFSKRNAFKRRYAFGIDMRGALSR